MISASRPSPTSSTLADVGLRARTLAAVGIAVAFSAAEFLRLDALTPSALGDVAVGWVLLAGGIVLWRGRPSARRPGSLMILTSLAWLAGGVLHRGPLTQLLLTAPSGRIENRRIRLVIAFAYADCLIETLVPLEGLTLAWCLVLGTAGLARVGRSSGMVRRGRLVAGAGAVAIASVVAIDRVAALLDIGVARCIGRSDLRLRGGRRRDRACGRSPPRSMVSRRSDRDRRRAGRKLRCHLAPGSTGGRSRGSFARGRLYDRRGRLCRRSRPTDHVAWGRLRSHGPARVRRRRPGGHGGPRRRSPRGSGPGGRSRRGHTDRGREHAVASRDR